MKILLKSLRCGVLTIALASAAFPQATPDTTAPSDRGTGYGTTDTRERDHNFGWVGLLGLAGLAGLMRGGRRDGDVRGPRDSNPR